MSKKKEIGTPYDDVFRTLITDSKAVATSLIREMFGVDIDPNAEMTTFQNEVFIAGNKKRVADSHLKYGGDEHYYHLECEAVAGDSGILVRLFEYDAAIALSHAKLIDNCLRIRFPKTGVVFLRHTENTPKDMWIQVEAPDSDEYITSKVAVIKVVSNLASGSDAIVEGVNELMGGQVLDYEAKRILNEGRQAGNEEHRKQSVIRMLDLGREPKEISDFTGEDYDYVQNTAREWVMLRENHSS